MKSQKRVLEILAITAFITASCNWIGEPRSTEVKNRTKNQLLPGSDGHNPDLPWAYDGITELKKGDIIVKPNLNFLPGTSYTEAAWNFGHAAIVVCGAENMHPDSLLASSIIFESHARDVSRMNQLREIRGYVLSDDPSVNNNSFGHRYTGHRYRLRLNVPESEIDSVIAFIRSQKGDFSCWNAMKHFPGLPMTGQMDAESKKKNWADNSHWYCSLIIWQAVLYVTAIDLDPNGGYFIYPSDLINSPYFDNKPGFVGRAVF